MTRHAALQHGFHQLTQPYEKVVVHVPRLLKRATGNALHGHGQAVWSCAYSSGMPSMPFRRSSARRSRRKRRPRLLPTTNALTTWSPWISTLFLTSFFTLSEMGAG